jgi:enoyl-CoA hydratase/carnithine racemase
VTSSSPILVETRAIPERTGSVAILTLNRPEQLNAMSWELITAFDAAIDVIEADADLRVLLITGSGRSFSAGGDLSDYVALQQDPVEFARFVSDLHRAFGKLRSLRIPTVALVNGVTTAGGLELILNCDVAVAAATARIGDAHLNFGQMGGGGVLTLLSRFVGLQRAAELIFTGKLLEAQEAASWGLVNRVVPDVDLMNEGILFAQDVAAKSPLAVANAKYVMTTIWLEEMSVEAGLKFELERNVEYCTTSFDAPEGLRAFNEKRTPKFEGR